MRHKFRTNTKNREQSLYENTRLCCFIVLTNESKNSCFFVGTAIGRPQETGILQQRVYRQQFCLKPLYFNDLRSVFS